MNRTRADLMRPETTSLHQCKAPRPKGSQGIHVSKTSFSFPMSQEDTNNTELNLDCYHHPALLGAWASKRCAQLAWFFPRNADRCVGNRSEESVLSP